MSKLTFYSRRPQQCLSLFFFYSRVSMKMSALLNNSAASFEKGKSKSPGASKPPALNSSASSSASLSAMGASPSLVNGGARFLHSECSTQFLTGFGAFSGPGALTWPDSSAFVFAFCSAAALFAVSSTAFFASRFSRFSWRSALRLAVFSDVWEWSSYYH